MYGLSAGTKKNVAVVERWLLVEYQSREKFWSHEILVYSYYAKQGCIQNLKRRVSLLKDKSN